MSQTLVDKLVDKCKQDIMAEEDAAIFAMLSGEPCLDYIVGMLKRHDPRLYICNYIKQYKEFTILRIAIQRVCPEHEITLDKLLVLK